MRMSTIVPVLLLWLSSLGSVLATAQDRPITTAQGKVGDLLRQWWKEGTAAGNVGDFYDNRDGSHSDLNLGPYPQLQKIEYTPDDIKSRRHWAAQRILLPHVVFGNSSTSAPPTSGGSNPRSYYTSPNGLQFLARQYTGNNVYIYPEHRDHDPGHNGRNDGFGDLYPTNTPYLIISQGSSGSDQPFMRAVPFTLAAFRPEVKKKLVDTGMLMPTLQMILRRTSKNLKEPADYLTARAHPTVFEGNHVNDLTMIQMAHDLQPDNLPPLVQLKVLEEDQPVRGKDFFDVHAGEKLADTPGVIARIFRGTNQKRRMVVSAAGSVDLAKKPLTYTWVLLRGDPQRVTIRPRGAEAEIIVQHHERRPIAPGSAMESNRVDIGVFAHNGAHHSAPAFVTWYSLDSEARTYDDAGKIVEIGHGMGENRFTITNWLTFLETATGSGLGAKLLNLPADQQQVLQRTLTALIPLQEDLAAAQIELKRVESQRKESVDNKAPEEKRKEAEANVQKAQKRLTAANKAIADLLDARAQDTNLSPRLLADQRLHELAREPRLLLRPELVEPARKNATVQNAGKRLVGLGLAKIDKEGSLIVEPLRARSWTAYELAQLERYHAAFLTGVVFSGSVASAYQVNFVDQRLTAPRDWRDVYRYDARGTLLGWTRYDGVEAHEFTPEGHLIEEKDAEGRPVEARQVTYVQEPLQKFGLNTNPLRMIRGELVMGGKQ